MKQLITPHVANETDNLEIVVLGLPESMGSVPALQDCYDAKSFESVKRGIYPSQEAVIYEMNELYKALVNNGVEVLRPEMVENYNQIFARDVSFVVDDTFFVSNLIPDRELETGALAKIIQRIDPRYVESLPEAVHTEGGDVLVHNDYLFVGCYLRPDYPSYKMARTNRYAIDFFRERFPDKEVLAFELRKHDHDPFLGTLHLDCAFQPVGRDKALLYRDAFINPGDLALIEDIFGKDNLFEVTSEEAYNMNTNVVSLSPQKLISDVSFVRLNEHLSQAWGIEIVPVPYQEISKMGGLLRCSTMPLVRRHG